MQRHGHFTEQLSKYSGWTIVIGHGGLWQVLGLVTLDRLAFVFRRVLWGDQDLDRGYNEPETQSRAWSAMQTADYSIVIFTTLPDP